MSAVVYRCNFQRAFVRKRALTPHSTALLPSALEYGHVKVGAKLDIKPDLNKHREQELILVVSQIIKSRI